MSGIKISVSSFNKPHWSEQDKRNVQIVLRFVQTLMNEHEVDKVKAEHGDAPYIQHNRNIKDGIVGVTDYFATMIKRFPDFSYDVKNVFVDGDVVIVHSHATMNKKHRGNERKGFNIVDKWRVENGKPVEHWDSVQALDGFMRWYYWLTGGEIKNNNGVFA